MLLTLVQTYLILINAVGLLIMLTDKRKARRGAWRIPEAVLMGTAFLGGSIGTVTGMYLFRHKTKHPKFCIGLPLILIAQTVLVLWIVSHL